jgi:aliphatic nitrilase
MLPRGDQTGCFPGDIYPELSLFRLVKPPAVIAKLHGRLYEQAVEVPGPVTEAVGRAAKGAGTVVVLGVNEREGGSLYNTQIN